jgi:hypothetical protein
VRELTLDIAGTNVDITPPDLAITSPVAGGTFNAATATLALEGTTADNLAVVEVTWENDRGGTGTATLTACASGTCWTAAGIALRGGVNNLKITARDAAGNRRSVALKVVFFTDTMQAGLAIKAAHFTELLEAINVLRARFGLAAAAFTGASSTWPAPGRMVRASHLNDLRQAMIGVCELAGCAVAAGAVPIVALGARIDAAPLEALRALVRQLG